MCTFSKASDKVPNLKVRGSIPHEDSKLTVNLKAPLTPSANVSKSFILLKILPKSLPFETRRDLRPNGHCEGGEGSTRDIIKTQNSWDEFLKKSKVTGRCDLKFFKVHYCDAWILLKFVPHCLTLFVTALLFILSWTICFIYLWFQWRYLVYNIRRPDWSQDCFQMHQIYNEMSYSASLTKLITCAKWTEGQLALIQGNLSIMTSLFLCLKA